MCIAITPAQAARLPVLRERLPATVASVFSHPRYLEIIAPGVDKSGAVAAACAALGLAQHELAAIGDAENDIGMLHAAGIGIAMGNASPAVIAAADRVTDGNDRDGVARAIEALLG
jgi:hydroxymethylpyrimidine pyrophosphatase-like HAD family hydrolase